MLNLAIIFLFFAFRSFTGKNARFVFSFFTFFTKTERKFLHFTQLKYDAFLTISRLKFDVSSTFFALLHK